MNINPFYQFPYPGTPEGDDHVRKYKGRYNFSVNPNHARSHIKYLTLPRSKSDVPTVCQNKDEMYSELEAAVAHAHGTNFHLGMYHEGEFHVWRRNSQPCQGGEMRKYGITHDDSTRPRDPRPGDLSTPFPDGKPLAVGAQIYGISQVKIDQMIRKDSPYRRAYGFEENVEVVKKSGVPVGIIIKDVSVAEPTMIVTLFKDLRWKSAIPKFDFFLDSGWTTPEILFLSRINALDGTVVSWGDTKSTDYLGNETFINLNFFKGGVEASTDLTGGTLGDRFDYHRPALTEVFKGPIGSNHYVSEIKSVCFPKGISSKELPKAAGQFREGIMSLKNKKAA